MLNNLDLNQKLFRVATGFPGKHPVSDRAAVIEELKAQGKWKGQEQIGNKTNESDKIMNTEITGNQTENIPENKSDDSGKAQSTESIKEKEGESNATQRSNSTPLMSSFWAIAIVFGAFMYVRKRN